MDVETGLPGVFRVRGLLRLFGTCFLRPDERILLNALIQVEENYRARDGADYSGVSIARVSRMTRMNESIIDGNLHALERYQLVHKILPNLEMIKARKPRRLKNVKSRTMNSDEEGDDLDDFESEGSVAELTSSSDDEEDSHLRNQEEAELRELKATKYAVDYRKGVQMASAYFKRLLAKLCSKIGRLDLGQSYYRYPAELPSGAELMAYKFSALQELREKLKPADAFATDVLLCLQCCKVIPLVELQAESLCPKCGSDLVRSTLLRAHRVFVDPGKITPESFRDRFERLYREHHPNFSEELLEKRSNCTLSKQAVDLVKLSEKYEPSIPIRQRLADPLAREEFERIYRMHDPAKGTDEHIDKIMNLDSAKRSDALLKLYRKYEARIPIPDCLRQDMALLQLGLTVYSFIGEKFVSLVDPEMNDPLHAVISAHDVMIESEVRRAAQQSQSKQALMYKPQSLNPKLISQEETTSRKLHKVENKLFRQAQQPSFLQSNVNSRAKNQALTAPQGQKDNEHSRSKRGREDQEMETLPPSQHLLPPWFSQNEDEWETLKFTL